MKKYVKTIKYISLVGIAISFLLFLWDYFWGLPTIWYSVSFAVVFIPLLVLNINYVEYKFNRYCYFTNSFEKLFFMAFFIIWLVFFFMDISKASPFQTWYLSYVAIGINYVQFIVCKNYEANKNTPLKWLPSESHFVDYEIVGKKIVFRYSISFQNNSDFDIGFDISAKFSRKETHGWLKRNETLSGHADCEKNGEGYILLHKNEKKNIVISFEGGYSGENVNTNLSFPELLMPIVISK